MKAFWEPQLEPDAREYQQLAARLSREHFAPIAEELDREGRYPTESVEVLVESGLAGMFIPEEYGGGGASLEATCAVMEEVGHACASTCGILAVYVLGAMPLLLGGSEEQKQFYLRAMAERGEAISFALTERDAGSDAGALQARAERVADGYHLTGEKWFIGNGGVSRYYVVFAKTDPDARHVSAFMVDREAAGVEIDTILDKMGIRGTMTSNLRLDCVVPPEALVGEEGRGMHLALGTLAIGRITLAGQALGLTRAAYEAATEWALERKTFGRPIIDYQGVAFPLADMATDLTTGRMLMYEVARAKDRGEDISVLGPMVKLFTSELSGRAVQSAVQIHGGYGFVRPTLVERLYRDQRALEIYEGTSEIQRLVISRAIAAAGRA